jgi:hypothetical protein
VSSAAFEWHVATLDVVGTLFPVALPASGRPPSLPPPSRRPSLPPAPPLQPAVAMNNPIQASPFYDYSTPLMNPQYANQGAAASRASGRGGSSLVRRRSAEVLMRRSLIDSFSGAARPAAARVAASPYTRPVEHLGPSSSVKASSTTSEFTKRKNWSQHIIDEIQVSARARYGGEQGRRCASADAR